MPDSGKFLILHSNHMASAPAEPAWDTELSAEEALTELVYIIRENGQDPTTQLAGYLIAEDPTYLPEGGHARTLARRIGRDKLLEALIAHYLRAPHHQNPHEI